MQSSAIVHNWRKVNLFCYWTAAFRDNRDDEAECGIFERRYNDSECGELRNQLSIFVEENIQRTVAV